MYKVVKHTVLKLHQECLQCLWPITSAALVFLMHFFPRTGLWAHVVREPVGQSEQYSGEGHMAALNLDFATSDSWDFE